MFDNGRLCLHYLQQNSWNFFFNMTNLIMIIPSKFCQVQVLFFMSKNCFELQNRFDIVLLVALIKSNETLWVHENKLNDVRIVQNLMMPILFSSINSKKNFLEISISTRSLVAETPWVTMLYTTSSRQSCAVHFCTVNLKWSYFIKSYYLVSIYLLKVNNRTTRTRYEICSKLTVKTLERRQWRLSGVFIVKFKHVLRLFLVFLLLTLNM